VDPSGVGSRLLTGRASEQESRTRLAKLDPALLLDAGGHAIEADAHLGAELFVARCHAVAEPGASLAARRLVAAIAGADVAVRRPETIAAVLLDAELLSGVGIDCAIVGSAFAPTQLHAVIELLSRSHPTQQQRNRSADARGSRSPIHLLLLRLPIVDPAIPGHVAEDGKRMLRRA